MAAGGQLQTGASAGAGGRHLVHIHGLRGGGLAVLAPGVRLAAVLGRCCLLLLASLLLLLLGPVLLRLLLHVDLPGCHGTHLRVQRLDLILQGVQHAGQERVVGLDAAARRRYLGRYGGQQRLVVGRQQPEVVLPALHLPLGVQGVVGEGV
jgi:hypothetical protein